jgi:hypothetical protein
MLWLKLFHALCWVYWLGADVGTYYAARFVANSELSPAQRATAAKIMLGIDLAPRICMPLTLASGVHLAALVSGLGVPPGFIAFTWGGCVLWLAVAVWLHHAPNGPNKDGVARWDFRFRAVLAIGLAVVGLTGWLDSVPTLAPFVAFKLLCFAATVACGLAIRIHLKDFGRAFGALVTQGPSAPGNAVIARSIAGCVPWVWGIWVLLLLSAAAGLHAVKIG